jgi:hypothetical protein
MAERRLAILLSGTAGTPDQRKEAEQNLAVIRKVLRKEPFEYSSSPVKNDLPEGTPEQLLRQARDPKAMRWERGKAAYAAGKALEGAGKNQEALAAYREAFELMRPVFPTYDGISWGRAAPASSDCALLRQVFAGVQRLDPATPNLMRGGLILRLQGFQLPDDMDLGLRVVLYDPAVKGAQHEAQVSLNRLAFVQSDNGVRLGVVDGRYRLSLSKNTWSYKTESSQRLGNLLEIDDPALDVDVRGDFKEYHVKTRTLQDIKALEPAHGATVDLQRDFFRWTAVEGATSYQVNFAYKEDNLQTSTFYGLPGVSVPTTSVCLGTLAPKEIQPLLRSKLSAGRTGTWSVEALDVKRRRVGTMVQTNHPFLVARGLAGK